MHSRIVGEFGVEGCGHGSSLPDGDRVRSFGGDDFDGGSDAGNLWGADEDHFERGFSHPLLNELTFADRAVDLASVGVTADADVDRAKTGLLRVFYFGRQENGSRTSAEGRLQADELFQLFKSFFPQQFKERTGLASGDDQAVDGIELLRLLDEDDMGAEFFETAAVGVEVSLQREHADGKRR